MATLLLRIRPRPRGRVVAAVVGGAIFVASPAPAQSSQAAAAEALFQQGLAASQRHDLATACARFRDSDKVDPANGTKLALADCEEQRGKLATAWSLFTSTVGKLPPTDKRIAVVKDRIAGLERRMPKLTLTLAPDAPKDTVVTEGGVELVPSMFGVALPTDPGPRVFVVRAGGYEDATLTVEAKEKQSVALVAKPGLKKGASIAAATTSVPRAAPASGATAEPRSVAPHDDARPNRTTGWVVAGAGVAGLALGATSYALALGKKGVADDNCRDDLRTCNATGQSANDSIRTLNVVTAIGLGLGAVGLGVGTWMLLRPEDAPKAGVSTGPVVVAGGAGWTVGGAF